MNIVGKKVTLRAIEAQDLELLNRWANDAGIQSMLGGWHFPTSMEDQRRWYAGLSASSRDQRFAIDTTEHGLIGTANLVDIDWKNRNAFHGMLLGDKEIRGKGYGQDTVMSIMRYAFEELGLERLDGSMIEYNEASLGLYLGKCGWKEEGRQRNWYFRKDRYWDRIMVGVTRTDNRKLCDTLGYWKD
jgi:RimJ/RimL family protein N-acetyltransferase